MAISFSTDPMTWNDIFTRCPHIGESVLKSLDLESALACQEVSANWKTFVKSPRVFGRLKKEIKEEDVTLHLAALEGKIHTAKMVLSMGLGDANQIYSCFRYIDGRQFHLDLTPLHAAVLMGHEEMIRYLISKGGDVNKHLYFRLVLVFWDFL